MHLQHKMPNCPVCKYNVIQEVILKAGTGSGITARSRHPKYVPNWCKATPDATEHYKDSLNNYLTNIDIPKELLSCSGACNMSDHHNLLDMYYNNIISCISCATEAVIPPHLVHNNQHNVPGWTECVAEKQKNARHAF